MSWPPTLPEPPASQQSASVPPACHDRSPPGVLGGKDVITKCHQTVAREGSFWHTICWSECRSRQVPNRCSAARLPRRAACLYAEIGVTCGGRQCEHAVVLDYRVRAATAEDARFLADVVCEATRAQGREPDNFDEPGWREEFGEQTMKQIRGEVPSSTTSVIEAGSERVGRLRVTRTAGSIELSGIQLLPQAQGHGVGTAIIEDLKAQAAAAGIPLDLDVEKDNPGALRLYERLGFVRAGQTAQEYKLRWVPPTTAPPPTAP